jgi:CheY-like chemotaxis protein
MRDARTEDAAKRVLVADDSRINQKVVGAMLERMGFRYDVVGTGAEAIEAASRTRYAAILMDCQMPIVDGYTATARIRARAGSIRHTPIIAMTASSAPGDRERCLAAGMDDGLSKPFTAEELGRMLARWTGAAVEPLPDSSIDPTPSHDGALEASVVADLRALGAAFARDSFRMFLGGTPGRIEALAIALEQGDREGVKEKAHVLRGSCGMIGARRLTELCAQIETGAARTPDGVESLVAAVRGEYRRVAAAVEAEIASLG